MSTLNVFADHHDIMPASGVKRWLLVTNHKDIDTTYLVFSLKMFFVGGAMAVLIRAELSQPGLQLVDPTLAGMPQRIPNYFVNSPLGIWLPRLAHLISGSLKPYSRSSLSNACAAVSNRAHRCGTAR
jgi:hypothetical protein